jgi:hypothetical protein
MVFGGVQKGGEVEGCPPRPRCNPFFGDYAAIFDFKAFTGRCSWSGYDKITGTRVWPVRSSEIYWFVSASNHQVVGLFVAR